MTYLANPEKVHEILATAMMILLFPTALVAMGYLNILNRFFAELKRKEPDVWEIAGSPSLAGMVFLPFWRFRKYYAFLPILRERAKKRHGNYRYAGFAYLLLRVGLVMTSALFLLAGITIFWIIYNGL